MELFFDTFNIYFIPPLLSLIMGVALAIVSLVQGKLKQQNILFSLLCIGWTLISSVFICHHVFKGNEELLLAIERRVHFFYVYLPPLNLLFFYRMTGTKSRFILPATFLLSFFLSLSTFTDYYFYGFYTYDWGYIAKGGIAFQVLELMGTALVVYLVIFFIRKIRKEKNQIMRLKLKYILLSFIMTGLLTMTNIPAMNGIDVYPLSNLSFLPLAFLGYGVLSYRLLEIRSVLHITLVWAVMSSLVVIPNVLLYIVAYPSIVRLSGWAQFAIAALWFYANYFYLSKIQPFIDQLFNKRKFDLYKIEASFIKTIAYLKKFDELVSQFIEVITKSLNFKNAEIAFCNSPGFKTFEIGATTCDIDPVVKRWFIRTNHLLDKDLVETKASYAGMRVNLLDLFTRFNAQYLVPFVQMGDLIGLLALPEKQNLRQLNKYEVSFINNIRSSFSIAMENAVMYSNLAILKENLEQIVDERTSELIQARDALLQDIELARKIQMTLLPQELPRIDSVEINFKYVPMLGVGGDFFDILIPEQDNQAGRGENEICFFICDVAGHGVPAAITAAMVKMSLSTWEKTARMPALLLSKICDSLKGKTGGNFITAMSCYINLKTGKILSANAGHPPLIIVRSDGMIEIINSQGRLISDYFEPDCEEKEIDLHAGDILVLYTDGITEEYINGEFYGEERFVEVLKSNSGHSVDALCNAVYDALIEFKGDPTLNDDFTILAMRYMPK